MASVKTIRALERGLDVLESFQIHPTCTLQDIHRTTQIPKPTLLRILETLQRAGVVTRRLGDGRYRISSNLTRIVPRRVRYNRVAEAAAVDPTAPALSVLDAVVDDPAIHELFASRMQSSRSYPIEGIDAGSLGHLEYLLGDEETRRVRGGNQRIAERLAEGLDVRCGERVRAVRQAAGGVEVVADSGTRTADACVVAVPVSIEIGRAHV